MSRYNIVLVITGWESLWLSKPLSALCSIWMPSDTIDTIETLLDGLLYETEDPEVRFKIRTILSLLSVVKKQNDVARTALSATDVPDDLQDDLIELGYLT